MSTTRKLLLYALYFIIVVAIGATIILAFTHHSNGKTTVVKAPTTSQKSPKTSTQTGTTSSPATNTSGESVKAAIAGTKPNSQLTNTGPGNVVALFGLTAVASSLVYRRRLLVRLSR